MMGVGRWLRGQGRHEKRALWTCSYSSMPENIYGESLFISTAASALQVLTCERFKNRLLELSIIKSISTGVAY